MLFPPKRQLVHVCIRKIGVLFKLDIPFSYIQACLYTRNDGWWYNAKQWFYQNLYSFILIPYLIHVQVRIEPARTGEGGRRICLTPSPFPRMQIIHNMFCETNQNAGHSLVFVIQRNSINIWYGWQVWQQPMLKIYLRKGQSRNQNTDAWENEKH